MFSAEQTRNDRYSLADAKKRIAAIRRPNSATFDGAPSNGRKGEPRAEAALRR